MMTKWGHKRNSTTIRGISTMDLWVVFASSSKYFNSKKNTNSLPAHWLCFHTLSNNVGSHTLMLTWKENTTYYTPVSQSVSLTVHPLCWLQPRQSFTVARRQPQSLTKKNKFISMALPSMTTLQFLYTMDNFFKHKKTKIEIEIKMFSVKILLLLLKLNNNFNVFTSYLPFPKIFLQFCILQWVSYQTAIEQC